MSDEDLLFEAARDLRRSLDPDLGAARRSTENKVRRRRRSRRLAGGSVCVVLAAAVAGAAWGLRGPADEGVVAGPGPNTEDVDRIVSTTLPTTFVPSTPSTAAPVTETRVIRVETLLGDIFDLTVPDTPTFAQPKVVLNPSPTGNTPGAALDVSVEPGPADQVVQVQCQNPVGPPGCVPSEQTDLGDGNTFVRWRLTRPDGSIQGGSAPELATVSNGEWTVLLAGPDFDEARRVAEGITISTSETGGPRLKYDDPRLRSVPFYTEDISLMFPGATDGVPIPIFLGLARDCSTLAPVDLNDSGRECIDGVGVNISDNGNADLAAQLRSVLRIKRIA